MKYWITTYALTTGVFKTAGDLSSDGSQFGYVRPDGDKQVAKVGLDAHKTRRGAMDRVHEMASREMQAIERKRSKLERLIIGLEGAVPA